MAEEILKDSTEEQAKRKAPAKRKTTAKRAAATPRKTTARTKTAAKRKATARGRAAKRKAPTLQERVTAGGRRAFLASLGFYGMAYDQMQDQLKVVEDELQARRKQADKLYADMVKRGEKVEKDARAAFDDIELPKLELNELTDRSKFEARIDKARERLAELRESVGFKTAA